MDVDTKPRGLVKDPAGTDVEMKIRGLVMDPATNMPIVILKDVKSDTVLPIWVGLFEANAIALEIEKATMPRPMTHDLLRNAIHGLNARVTRVVVGSLREEMWSVGRLASKVVPVVKSIGFQPSGEPSEQ